jgi:predicted NBD/HSP70 family sugar kinase
VLSRELERQVQAAALAFDERMRELREDAAARLARELDRAVEMLGREELVRRVEAEAAGAARPRS